MDLPPPPPLITVEELPSEPGCRTLATKTCYKTPIVINKKVRHETHASHRPGPVKCGNAIYVKL